MKLVLCDIPRQNLITAVEGHYPMFGRVMKLDLIQDASSLLGRKGFIQARAIVCVQIVLDQTNFLRLRIITNGVSFLQTAQRVQDSKNGCV